MTFIKRLNNNDTGDSTHLGGDHWDTLDKYLDNTDIESTTGKAAKINTKTEFRDGKLIVSNGTNTYTIKTGTLSAGDVDLTLPSLGANGTLMSTGGSNTFTASQTFTHQLLKLLNPAGTFSYILNGSAIIANRNITIPLLTADDEIMMKAFAQTPTNKTWNIDTNTLKHSTTNAEGDILIYDTTAGKFIRLAGGTDGQILTRVSGDTAWADATGGSGGSSSELDYIEQARNRVGFIQDFFDISTTSNYETSVSGTGAGFSLIDTEDLGVFGVGRLTTGTTTTGRAAVYGSSSTTSQAIRLGQGITTMEAKIRLPTLSAVGEQYKLFFGLLDDGNLASSTDLVSIEYDPAGYGFSNYFMVTLNDGVGTATGNISFSPSANTWTRLKLVANAAASSVTFYIDGLTLGTKSNAASIPSSTGDELYPVIGIKKSTGTTARTLDIDYIAVQVDLTTPR